MRCPKCLGSMSKITVSDIIVDRCDTCGGLWFDTSEATHLNAIRHSEKIIDTGDPALGQAMNKSRNIECPRCHTPLIKMVIPQQTHIPYESCTVCQGLFFDAGEFTDAKHLTIPERIQSFISQLRK